MIELTAYLVLGTLAGVLAGLFGVGGGLVLVPSLMLLYEWLGMASQWISHLAIGTSLAAIVGTGLASARAHQRRGAVRWDLVARLTPGIILGAWLGAMLAGILPEPWLKRLFAAFLLVVSARMLLPEGQRHAAQLPGVVGLWCVGAAIGVVSALVGIGGGTLTVPYLNRHGIDLRQAVGTAAAAGVPIALAGAIGFMLVGWGRAGLPELSSGFIHWPAVGTILIASIPTAPLGAALAHRLPVTLLRRLFACLLLVIALQLAI
ncbi:MAG: sulfite exporter TauE/SafE family protein [Sphingobacteriia bacterium]|nr:sulfite exporter TauE/SafE family protein [Sphingobacteriia bacterium]NCC40187.1 sulfite exporter TauE/SafE family protein [Gammaproteobacteria bacterium]